MNKEFIPYEQALHLKELGFNEHCMFHYHRNNTDYVDSTYVELTNYNATEKLVSAVLYQQAFRWFREKYGLLSFVDKCLTDTFRYNIQLDSSIIGLSGYATHEEAELACLKKLIEIIKNK